jgi:hypothetical protein
VQARNLSEHGVMAMNFWGATDRYVENLIPAQRVFRRNLRLVNIPSGNVVLFASNRALPVSATLELERRATRLRDILSLDFPHFLNRLCQGESVAG